MTRRRRWWPILRAALTLAILAAVGWQFVRILEAPELRRTDDERAPTQIIWDHVRAARPEWLAAAGGLYLLGLGFPALYWARLQRHLGQRLPGPLAICRAYYVSHLGKYLPGKAWALVLRASLVAGPGVRAGVAGMASFYEVLATMTGGALLAAVLFALLVPDAGARPDWATIKALFSLRLDDSSLLDRRLLVMTALLVALPVGVPILPPLFNRLVERVSLPFRREDAGPPPQVRFSHLAEGLVLSCGTWLLFGASMMAVFYAVLPGPLAWSLAAWGRHTALFAVGYVSSFLVFWMPGSLVVREYFLILFLVPEIVALTGLGGGEARLAVVIAVVILRLIWIVAELLVSAALYWLPSLSRRSAVA